MARRRKTNTYTVAYKPGLNLRAKPSKEAEIIRVLKYGEAVEEEEETLTPDGWLAVKGGGYVMREFLE